MKNYYKITIFDFKIFIYTIKKEYEKENRK